MIDDMCPLTIISRHPEETILIGKLIGGNLNAGDILALIGELGSGKTCLSQGIAMGLGVPDGHQITSPSFTLINEYQGRMPLYHIDLYRLSGVEEVLDMGYEEYLFGDGVTIIEWADKVREILPHETIFIYLTYLDENKREMLISGRENKVVHITDALKEGGYI